MKYITLERTDFPMTIYIPVDKIVSWANGVIWVSTTISTSGGMRVKESASEIQEKIRNSEEV